MAEKAKAVLYGLGADVAFNLVVLLLGALTRAEVLGASREHMMVWLMVVFFGVAMTTEIAMDRKTIFLMWDTIAAIIIAGVITLFFNFEITTFELTKVVPEMSEPFFGAIMVILFALFGAEPLVNKTSRKED